MVSGWRGRLWMDGVFLGSRAWFLDGGRGSRKEGVVPRWRALFLDGGCCSWI